MAADALDHLAIDEGLGRAVVQLQFQAPGFRDNGDLEVTVERIEFTGIVHVGAGVEYGQCASAEQLVYLLARRSQTQHFLLRQQIQALNRPDGSKTDFLWHEAIPGVG